MGKIYDVAEGEFLTAKDIEKLLEADYTHYRLPMSPHYPYNIFRIHRIPHSRVLKGMLLIWDEHAGVYSFVAVMSEDWVPSRRPYEVWKEKMGVN